MYNRDEIKEMVFNQIASSLGLDINQLSENTDIKEEFDAQSLSYVQIIGEIEDEYGYDLNFMSFRKQETVGDIIDYVLNEVNK